jgi:predicted DNA-binding antitoxin AbrB/MazE fold protein
MSQPIRAIYSEGQLRLLDPVGLTEGQEIQLLILSDQERVRVALGDLLLTIPDSDVPDETFDEVALMREIETGFRGQPPLSDTIIEERREGR